MSASEVTKYFDLCYGHRVWIQTLDPEFTDVGHVKPKCRHLHGHQGRVGVTLYGDVQDDGMIVDLVHFGWLKHWLDEHLDHKFIVDIRDPLLHDFVGKTPAEIMKESHELPLCDNAGVGEAFNLGEHGTEVQRGFVFVPFVPTSENLSQWIADLVAYKMSHRFADVISAVTVTWQETPTSVATFTREIPFTVDST